MADVVSENGTDLGQFLLEQISALSSQIEQVHNSLLELRSRSSAAWISKHTQDAVTLQRLQRVVHHAREVFLFQVSIDIEHTLARLSGSASETRQHILSKIQEVRQNALVEIRQRLPSDPPSVGHRLPARPPWFFGRHEESETIISTLISNQNAHVAILGTPGIGKTTLALSVLHDQRLKDRFADRRYFVTCEGANSKDDLLSAIAAQLGIHGDGLQRKIVDRLSEHKTILVLDNFETSWEPLASKGAVEQLLVSISAIPCLSLILTMRGAERPSSSVKWARPFLPPLKPLQSHDCRRIFLAWSNCTDDDPNVDRLLSMLDGLPLAITLMATLAQTDTPEILIQRWQTESSSLLHRGADRRSSLDLSIKLSIDSERMRAVPEALELLSLISLLHDVENRKIQSIFPNIVECRKALSTLWQTTLAFNDGSGRTRVLSPIRAYMTRHHNARSHLRSMIAYYMGLAALSSELGGTHGKHIIYQLMPDIWNIHSAVKLALQGRYEEPDDSFLRGAIKASIDFSKFARYAGLEAEILHLALVNSQTLADRPLQADILFHLAWHKYVSASHVDAESCCERAGRLYEETANLRGQAECAWLMGQIRKDTARQKDCEALYKKGLALALQAGDKYCQAKCLSNLAEIAFYAGNVAASEQQAQQALSIFRGLEHLTNIGMTLFWLGRIETFRSHHTQALAYYEEAAEVLEKAGAHQQVGRVLTGRGDVSFSRCDFMGARRDYQRAIDNFRASGTLNNSTAAYAYLSLGEAAAALAEFALARECLDTAYQTFKKRRSTHGILHCHILYGDLALAEGDTPLYAEADSYFQEALAGARSAEFSEEIAIINGRLGKSAGRQGRVQSAEQHFVIAMTFYRKMNNSKGLASIMVMFGDCLLQNNDRVSALSLFHAALPICRKFEAVRDVSSCLLGIGHII